MTFEKATALFPVTRVAPENLDLLNEIAEALMAAPVPVFRAWLKEARDASNS